MRKQKEEEPELSFSEQLIGSPSGDNDPVDEMHLLVMELLDKAKRYRDKPIGVNASLVDIAIQHFASGIACIRLS